jgi:hypothetical protein
VNSLFFLDFQLKVQNQSFLQCLPKMELCQNYQVFHHYPNLEMVHQMIFHRFHRFPKSF